MTLKKLTRLNGPKLTNLNSRRIERNVCVKTIVKNHPHFAGPFIKINLKYNYEHIFKSNPLVKAELSLKRKNELKVKYNIKVIEGPSFIDQILKSEVGQNLAYINKLNGRYGLPTINESLVEAHVETLKWEQLISAQQFTMKRFLENPDVDQNIIYTQYLNSYIYGNTHRYEDETFKFPKKRQEWLCSTSIPLRYKKNTTRWELFKLSKWYSWAQVIGMNIIGWLAIMTYHVYEYNAHAAQGEYSSNPWTKFKAYLKNKEDRRNYRLDVHFRTQQDKKMYARSLQRLEEDFYAREDLFMSGEPIVFETEIYDQDGHIQMRFFRNRDHFDSHFNPNSDLEKVELAGDLMKKFFPFDLKNSYLCDECQVAREKDWIQFERYLKNEVAEWAHSADSATRLYSLRSAASCKNLPEDVRAQLEKEIKIEETNFYPKKGFNHKSPPIEVWREYQNAAHRLLKTGYGENCAKWYNVERKSGCPGCKENMDKYPAVYEKTIEDMMVAYPKQMFIKHYIIACAPGDGGGEPILYMISNQDAIQNVIEYLESRYNLKASFHRWDQIDGEHEPLNPKTNDYKLIKGAANEFCEGHGYPRHILRYVIDNYHFWPQPKEPKNTL